MLITYTAENIGCRCVHVNMWDTFFLRQKIDRGIYGPTASYWMVPGMCE